MAESDDWDLEHWIDEILGDGARAVHRWERMDIHALHGRGWMKPFLIGDVQAVFYRNAPSN